MSTVKLPGLFSYCVSTMKSVDFGDVLKCLRFPAYYSNSNSSIYFRLPQLQPLGGTKGAH